MVAKSDGRRRRFHASSVSAGIFTGMVGMAGGLFAFDGDELELPLLAATASDFGSLAGVVSVDNEKLTQPINQIRATLNANDHSEYAVNSRPIEAIGAIKNENIGNWYNNKK